MKIKVLKAIPKDDGGVYEAGEVVEVASAGDDCADPFWMRRLYDAEIDQCCEVVKSTKKAGK